LALAKTSYLLTGRFPKDELFGMTSQIRRASVSIPANIAEGNVRETTGDYIRFLRIAQGSLKELETHLILSYEVEICPQESTHPLLEQADQLGRMLRALIRSLQSREQGIGSREIPFFTYSQFPTPDCPRSPYSRLPTPSRRRRPWRYRWPDEFRDEVLARLLDLNKKRAEQEKLAGAGEKPKKGGRKKKVKDDSEMFEA
jgi:four helix bundle protein